VPLFSRAFRERCLQESCLRLGRGRGVETARAAGGLPDRVQAHRVVFTSGATESDNLALKGVAYAYREKGMHLITSQIEHHAVLDTCKRLEKEGFHITYVPVGRDGIVNPAAVAKAITPRPPSSPSCWPTTRWGRSNPGRGRPDLQGTGSSPPQRCGAGRGENPGQRGRVERGSLVPTAHKIYGRKVSGRSMSGWRSAGSPRAPDQDGEARERAAPADLERAGHRPPREGCDLRPRRYMRKRSS